MIRSRDFWSVPDRSFIQMTWYVFKQLSYVNKKSSVTTTSNKVFYVYDNWQQDYLIQRFLLFYKGIYKRELVTSSPANNYVLFIILHSHNHDTYTYLTIHIYMRKHSPHNNDERSLLFWKIFLSHFIRNGCERVTKGLSVRGKLETEQTVTYWPPVSLSLAALLSRSIGGPEGP